ncbi:hypothetical protein B0H10DRAFT_2444692 [Mycena sp. CBHHK59/15]|nr:hypothetical protein B0H10DRAFT_2444692 [Mycena sp. CBHHK59/15]
MSTSQRPRRSSRARAPSVRMDIETTLGATSRSRTRSAPPPLPPDVVELHSLSKELGPFTYGEPWHRFLAKFQEVMEAHHPWLLHVNPRPIMFVDQQRSKTLHPKMQYTAYDTLRGWVDNDAKRGRSFSLTVLPTPTRSVAGYTMASGSSADELQINFSVPESNRFGVRFGASRTVPET